MKVLVTGAGGFIGRSLTKHLLKKGYVVVALVRSPIDITYGHQNLIWKIGDIRDSAFVHACVENVDYVVHLAARKSDEKDSLQTNINGMENLIRACEQSLVRGIVNISTISTKFHDKGVYAATKNAADELLHKSNTASVTIQLSVVYGDGSEGVFASLIRYIKLPIVPIIGDGKATFRPIFIDDVALAIEHVLARSMAHHQTYDLGGPTVISFNELVSVLSKSMCNKEARLLHVPIWISYIIAQIGSRILKHPPITVSNVLGMRQSVNVITEPLV